jgi:crossover junction endodeoxyribonuclease RuvC
VTTYIGIDPGFTCTGVVGVERSAPFSKITGVAAFSADKDGAVEVRAVRLARRVFYYAYGLTGGADAILCIEENISAGHGNAATAMMQRELVGILCGMAVEHGWRVKRVYPVTAKKALTDNGRADKDEMVAAARKQFGVPGAGMPKPKAEAIADAIGVALAGIAKGAANV